MTITFVALLVFLMDRGTKFLVQLFMVPGEEIPILSGVFHITYIRNPGAAFGVLPYKTGFFIGITLLVLGAIVIYGRKIANGSKLLGVAMGLELGGALGNLVDRLSLGMVVDFLDFRVWPVFNLADSAIVIGVLLFGYELLWGTRFSEKGNTEGSG